MSRTQYRIYKIADGHLDDFVHAWKTAIVPFRAEMGFVVEKAWVDKENSQFHWILSVSGEEPFADVEKRYMEVRATRTMPEDVARYGKGIVSVSMIEPVELT